MTKSATELMQEIIFAAVIDSVGALKTASKGLPNTLLRDINAIHANTTFADLPKELQATITGSVRTAFTRLLKEGYSVSTGQPPAPRASPPPFPRGGGGGPGGHRRPAPKRDGPAGGAPPRGGGRPGRKPPPNRT
jgi:hypothetical protein